MKIEDFLLREALGRKIMEVSQICSEGYINAVSEFMTPADQAANAKCAVAASNTGYFILKALGFDGNEIQTIAKAYRQS